MSHYHWDELTKSLAEESLPRRESLRRIGVMLAGAVLSPLGLATAWAAPKRGPTSDPCKDFCNQCPKSQRSQCVSACKACGNDTSRLCGRCGAVACCDWPGPYENGACIDGRCEYWCVDGADYCDGVCRDLASDVYNCGACGYVCDGLDSGPDVGVACVSGECKYSFCPPDTNYLWDRYNCGACGRRCRDSEVCHFGICASLGPAPGDDPITG
jgi:hypothetical protein